MFEVIEDTLIDGVKLVPFLFITYLFMEILEHKMNNNLNSGGESLFGRYHNSRNAYCRIYVNL